MSFLPDSFALGRPGRLIGSLSAYFFSPMSPVTLSGARIIIFGLIFWKSLSRAWFLIPDWPEAFLVRLAAKGVPYIRADIFLLLTAVLAAASLLGVLGIAVRPAAALCFATLYLFNAADGGVWDSGWLLFSILLLMSCSRSQDSLCLRHLWVRSESRPSWEYRWPLRAMQLALVLIYFENGIGKLTTTGWRWTAPETLQGWYFDHLWLDTHYFELGRFLVDYPELARVSAIGTLILETGAILMVFVDSSKWVLVPSLGMMHLLIGLTLNIWFTEYFFLLLLFFDWELAWERSRLWARRGPRSG